MKKSILILFVAAICFCSCQNESGSKTANKETKTAEKSKNAPAQAAGKVNTEIKAVLQELLPLCEKVEYVFYKQGMSFSTETQGQQATLSYFNFVSDIEVPKHNCKYDGGAVFRSPDGDIVLTADFVLNDPKCKSFVITAKNKTYYQKMEDVGYQYIMQFYNIDMSGNNPNLTPKQK